MSNEKDLYAKRKKIYPRTVSGLFNNLRVVSVLSLMGIYYLIPWINWNGRQMILYDLPARKFYFFDTIIWPQDFFYLALLLIIAALALFFFTNLMGRVWCGYACPQTVWTQISFWLDRLTVGSRQSQIKLAKMPWNFYKTSRISLKFIVWIVFVLWTGLTFVGWFSPIRGLFTDVINFNASITETFWIGFYAFATWGMAGFLREQVCFYMCPYARFQSVMFDHNTLIISYDYNRGEPRGKMQKGKIAEGNGDCVDCGICVQACPTGIDIRDGLQYECIACTACIDACDEVMKKVGLAKGLIRYTTENALLGNVSKILRPRLVMYGLVLIIFMISFVFAIGNRNPLDLNIIRDRSSLYQEDNEGNILNIYTLKLMNMDSRAHEFELSVISNDIKDIIINADVSSLNVKSGGLIEVPLNLSADPTTINKQSNEVIFTLRAKEDSSLFVKVPTRFIGPTN